jgi:hypothetical protein
VLNPYGRVPVSFIIDDSTCLANLGHFCLPQVEYAKGIAGDNAECVVNIPSCTGDYLGAWDGSAPNPTEETIEGQVSADLQSGRLVEVINKGEPACFLTHWPGMYANGTGAAFRTFQGTVKRLNAGFGERIRWVKLSAIARYWAAKELTAIELNKAGGVRSSIEGCKLDRIGVRRSRRRLS